jgi:hypothetical protein
MLTPLDPDTLVATFTAFQATVQGWTPWGTIRFAAVWRGSMYCREV